MAKEEIIKSLQRTRNDDGDMKVIFPITSADAVYVDFDKKITVADKLSMNDISDDSVTYYNIYSNASLGGTGALKITLPDIKDNTIDVELSVNSGKMSRTADVTKLTVPTIPSSTTPATQVINEMSDNGAFIFISLVRSGTYINKLYRTAQGSVIELPFALKSITVPMRARFSRSGANLIVYGTDSLGDTTIEVHRINSLYGSHTSTVYTNPVDFGNGISANITYFDTASYNGEDYLITNNPATNTSFACFKIQDATITVDNTLYTRDTYIIENDFRISPNSSKIAILSKDTSVIHCMAHVGLGQYRFRTAGDNMNQYAWGSSSNTNGVKVGKWRKISFNEDGTKLYGTYLVGNANTVRICELTNTYGEYTSAVKEISLKTNTKPFDIGLTIYRPIPNNTIYNSSAPIDIVGVGTFSQSTSIEPVSGIVRFTTSTLPTTTSTVSFSSSSGSVSELGYFLNENNITYSYAEHTLMSSEGFADIRIHPTNGYGYATYINSYDISIVPVYLGQKQPEIRLSTNPSITPIMNDILFADFSYDGNAVAYINSGATPRVRVADKVDGRFIHRNTSIMYLGTTNKVMACKIINNGDFILCMYQTGFKFFKFVNNAYVEQSIIYTGDINFLSTTGHAYMSPTQIDGDRVTWASLRVEYTGTEVKLNVHKYLYEPTSGLVITNTPVNETTSVHSNVIGASFNYNCDRLAVITNDNGIMRLGTFSYSNGTYTRITFNTLEDGYYSPTVKNNCALVDTSETTSIVLYANTNGIIRPIHVNWATASTVYGNSTALGIPTTAMYPCGIKYAYGPKRLIIGKNTSGEIYAYWYTNSRFELIEMYTDSESYNSSIYVNDMGTILLATDSYPSRSRLIDLMPINISGHIKMTGRFTGDRWENVIVTSDNPSLESLVAFGVDESGKTVILIGDADTIWNPLNVDITKITITGPTAKKFSYKIGYGSELISDTSLITNTENSTEIVTETEITKRLTIKSYNIEPSTWSENPISGYYVCKIYNSNITQNTTVNININDLTSWTYAHTFGIIGLSIEHDGYVEIFAANKPSTSIFADIDIFV